MFSCVMGSGPVYELKFCSQQGRAGGRQQAVAWSSKQRQSQSHLEAAATCPRVALRPGHALKAGSSHCVVACRLGGAQLLAADLAWAAWLGCSVCQICPKHVTRPYCCSGSWGCHRWRSRHTGCRHVIVARHCVVCAGKAVPLVQGNVQGGRTRRGQQWWRSSSTGRRSGHQSKPAPSSTTACGGGHRRAVPEKVKLPAAVYHLPECSPCRCKHCPGMPGSRPGSCQ